MAYKVIRPADHAGWLAERAKGIGSSEVGTIFGVNSFDTPLQLWRRKTHRDPPTEESEVMMLGHAVEGGVAYMFSRLTGAIIDESSTTDWLAVDEEHPWRRVSPDRMFWPAGTPESERTLANATMLECKTTSHNINKDELPDYWFCQIQYQMGVLGLKSCCIGWITAFGGRWHFDWTEVEFNRAFFDTLMEQVDAFWLENVCRDIEPEAVITLEDAAKKWSRASSGKSAVAGEEVISLVRELTSKKAEGERLKKECDAAELRIKEAMRDAETLVDGADHVLATWKEYEGRTSFDQKAFQESHPEEYAKWVRRGDSYRRFTVRAPRNS